MILSHRHISSKASVRADEGPYNKKQEFLLCSFVVSSKPENDLKNKAMPNLKNEKLVLWSYICKLYICNSSSFFLLNN